MSSCADSTSGTVDEVKRRLKEGLETSDWHFSKKSAA